MSPLVAPERSSLTDVKSLLHWPYAERPPAGAFARYGNPRRGRPISAPPDRERDEHLQPQSDHDWSEVLVARDTAAAGPCGRDLPHPRAPEDSAALDHRDAGIGPCTDRVSRAACV